MEKIVQLVDICMARSGDKGDIVNIGLMAPNAEVFEAIKQQVTAERVQDHFGNLVKGSVKRYELPNILSLNFVLHGALEGGGQRCLRVDALGKCFAPMLCKMEIKISTAVLHGVNAVRFPRQ